MMNLFQPSVKLLRKVRVGSRLTRRYDRPQTPLDRLLASGQGDPAKIAAPQHLRTRLDPFALADAIDRKLQRIYHLANARQHPRSGARRTSSPPRAARIEPETLAHTTEPGDLGE